MNNSTENIIINRKYRLKEEWYWIGIYDGVSLLIIIYGIITKYLR